MAIGAEIPGASELPGKAWYNSDQVNTLNVWWDSDQPQCLRLNIDFELGALPATAAPLFGTLGGKTRLKY